MYHSESKCTFMDFSERRRGLGDADLSLPALNPRALQENRGSPFIGKTIGHIQIALYRLQSVLICIIFLKENYIGVQLIYNVMLVSGVQQSESFIYIHISTLFQILSPYVGQYKVLSRIACSIQKFLISYLFCISFKLPGMHRALKNLPRTTLGKCQNQVANPGPLNSNVFSKACDDFKSCPGP